MLLESFETGEEEYWLAGLNASDTDETVTKDFESDAYLFCSLPWMEPFRLIVPSDITLADIEDMEMAECCLHVQSCDSSSSRRINAAAESSLVL